METTDRMRHALLLFAACSFTSFAAFPATPTGTLPTDTTQLGIIDTVILLGNAKTENFVILDEMTLKPGMGVSRERMEYDRGRIYSLGLFTRVNIDFQPIDTTGYLIVDVSERWYIFPVPILGFRDGDPKKAFFGAGLIYDNFRGRAQSIYFAFALGFDPSVNLEYQDPLIDRGHRLYFSSGFSVSTVRNRSQLEEAVTGDFDEHHIDGHAGIGKRFDLYQTMGIDLGYHVASVTNYRVGRTMSPTSRDAFVYATLDYRYDTRNLREYATQGAYCSASLTKYGLGESLVDFARISFDFRRYDPLIEDFSLASRAYLSFVEGGRVPTYSRAYLGYGDRVRGYYTTIFEGDDIGGGTIELRYSLLHARTIDVTSLPIPDEFALWRFGISLALFADVGTTWFRGDLLPLRSLATGYGAGIHFLLPYSFVARVEYALNNHARGQLILDLRGSI